MYALLRSGLCASFVCAMGYADAWVFARREFETIVDGLSDALDFSRTIGVDAGVANAYERGGGRGTLGEVDFYTRYARPLLVRSFPATWLICKPLLVATKV